MASLKKRRLDDLEVEGRSVLVRVDFNVPLDESLQVVSDARIRASLPTVRGILERKGRPILMSHLGRPKGREVEALRLAPVAERLQALLPDVKVLSCRQCAGPYGKAMAKDLGPGQVLLLENLRFRPEEERGDLAYARLLATLGEAYVNDAFGAAHRPHASVSGVPQFLPSAMGLLLEKEVEVFARLLEGPERPFAAVLGGAKVGGKLPLLRNLLSKVDAVLVGGGMAYTFLKARGAGVGRSLVEEDLVEEAKQVLREAERKGVRLLLPVDHVVAGEVSEDATVRIVEGDVPAERKALDVGPRTVEAFAKELQGARTVFWNGPMGVFELSPFRAGTEGVALAVAACKGFTVAGGGDSVAAIEQLGLADRLSHVSTGGGAGLELLEGRELPGLAALPDR